MNINQKRKNVIALHEAYKAKFPTKCVLEVSSKSLQAEVLPLSAFKLQKFVPNLQRTLTVENICQGGKIFENGGLCLDMYDMTAKEAKKDERLHSLSAQISYYSEMIQSHPGWLYAGVYSDEALTGTKENRRGFQALLEDCRTGKIDVVIVKSISRLARNTVTLLETVRELRIHGVDVYFEEQNIHTLSFEGELMLTILASYAQESLSVSENQKWRIQKNFKEGKPWNDAMLGFRNVNGTFTVILEEAELVKRIFDMYLSGMGIQSIANMLNREGIPTRLGAKFKYTGIHKMLRNEAHAGNLLLQKTFKDNHITKRTIINRGELPMYYVENAHEPIIPLEIFRRVQKMITQRAEKYAPPATESPLTYRFTSLITCAKCGKHFRRKLVRGKPVWICPTFNYEG